VGGESCRGSQRFGSRVALCRQRSMRRNRGFALLKSALCVTAPRAISTSGWRWSRRTRAIAVSRRIFESRPDSRPGYRGLPAGHLTLIRPSPSRICAPLRRWQGPETCESDAGGVGGSRAMQALIPNGVPAPRPSAASPFRPRQGHPRGEAETWHTAALRPYLNAAVKPSVPNNYPAAIEDSTASLDASDGTVRFALRSRGRGSYGRASDTVIGRAGSTDG